MCDHGFDGDCYFCSRLAGQPVFPAVAAPVMTEAERARLIHRSKNRCIHLGPEIERPACGCVIRQCAVHGRCLTVANAFRPEQCCQTCGDYDNGKTKSADLTIAITEWRRPKALARLLASIRKHLPGYAVEVESTHGNLSAGRNRLYARVKTPYLLMMEEDFVTTPSTAAGIASAMAVLAYDATMSGVGGIAREKQRGDVRWGHNFIRRGNVCYIEPSQRPLRYSPTGIEYRPCDLILNWGVFRTDLFRAIPYDESIPITEHKEWFWRASRAGYQFALYGGLLVEHRRDRPNSIYNRGRARKYYSRITAKHGFRFAHRE